MLQLLLQGHVALFALILFAIVFSLTVHELGHAACAKFLGDDTAERAGRLTLNPVAHIDPLGLLMVVAVGFGYARPVPVTPSRLRYPWADAAVAFAGPFMNLVLAFLCVNLLVWGTHWSTALASNTGLLTLLSYMARINILLMLFNLIPLGPLDGNHILRGLLPTDLSRRFDVLNARFGTYIFLALIVASVMGFPVFQWLVRLSDALLPWLVFAQPG